MAITWENTIKPISPSHTIKGVLPLGLVRQLVIMDDIWLFKRIPWNCIKGSRRSQYFLKGYIRIYNGDLRRQIHRINVDLFSNVLYDWCHANYITLYIIDYLWIPQTFIHLPCFFKGYRVSESVKIFFTWDGYDK